MRRLFYAAVHHRLTVFGIVALLVGLGIYGVMRVPFDAFPDLTGTRVEVITTAPGMAPEDVERLVTFPIESALMGIPGATQVRSVSKFGLSLITVPFPDDADVYFSRTLVAMRLNDAKDRLPAGIEPTLGPVSTPMGELYQYVVTSDSLSLTELTTLHDYVIRPRLRTLAGVSEVNSWGGLTEQVHVVVDPIRLAARRLTLGDVDRALSANNVSFGGSYLERAGERFTVRGLGRVESRAEIADIVVGSHAGAPIRIRDVATIEQGALPRAGAVTRDGVGEVVSGMVLKLQGADSRAVIRDVRARMEELARSLPSHVQIVPFYDQTDLIGRTTTTIVRNLIEGGLLVVAVLFLFLRNIRASLIVASVIPLSMLIAFFAMYRFGYTANLMSLGALDFGLIVDASVVMVENFIRRLEKGRPAASERRALFIDAATEVGRPILFGIAIIVAVYIPVFSLTGMEGRMFKPMAFTVVAAVLVSLLLALTFVPAISAWVLDHADETPSPFFTAIRSRYERALEWSLARGKILVGLSVAAVVTALVSLSLIGSEFMPQLDEGSILINTRRLPSVSLDDATRISLQVERIVKQFPEVLTVVTKEGRPDLATEAMGLFEGDLYVILKERGDWTTAKTSEGLVTAFDSALAVVPGVEIAFTQPLAMRLDEAESGIRTDLGVKVVSEDFDSNAAIAERILRIIERVPGNADASVEVSEGSGQIAIRVRRDAMAVYGLSVADVQETLELAMGTRVATEMVQGPRRIGVSVRYPAMARNDIDALNRLTIRTPSGGQVPMGSVADLVTTTGPELIGHEDGQRRALVLSNVRGRDLGSFVREVRTRVASDIVLPPGTFLEWGGEYENQQRAMARLRIVVPLALLLILLLLFATFGSFPHALLVLSNVPFALVGGVAVLWLRGLNLNLSASIGFIALFGVAVLNGVVLVTYMNTLRAEGMPLARAVRVGALDRLRPVLMTALVASLGFVPMALSTSPGSEVQRPLASVVIGGLVTSTVLTLFVLPTLYLMLTRWLESRAASAARDPEAAPVIVGT